MKDNQLSLPGVPQGPITPKAVWEGFDPARLTQARYLAGMTKKDIAAGIGVSPAAVGQYETGSTRPRPDLIPRLAEVLDVPITFFLAGRPHGKLDSSMAHFRTLRSTSGTQRNKALSFAEQVWELTYALEKRVQLPPVNLPGFAGGEIHPGIELSRDPVEAARQLREYWNLGEGPVRHLVRQIEAHGIVVVTPGPDETATKTDAFSSSGLPRPLAVLTPNRSDDVYRHRFSAAHELGHLVLHAVATGEAQQEREADMFAAEFLTPRTSLHPLLSPRIDFSQLVALQRTWGVSVHSLIYRYREFGLVSDATISRAYQRLNTLKHLPGFSPEPVNGYPGEQPTIIWKAFELAEKHADLTVNRLAAELAWKPNRVRQLLGIDDTRPVLRIV
ncbi:Zn-dependent peptidase ImmA, M78 family [Sinosporangium album]|uniref:Zn-dependent peptidase ImmA, M78 family n=2 Tax=Sinosporangium album TaxID=504805 RepID=A0A1G8JB09_9ACTN|nr:Zn-dependent peptidase ImmA, M78 family [Sinosporangium album]